jgi:C4-dicarboxylate-binding protein DctP
MKITCDTMNDVQHEWLKRLAARIAERSGGRIKTEMYPGGQLGKTPRIIDGIQLGTIEAYVVPAANYVGVDPRFQVTAAPGWFKDIDHAFRTINDPRFRNAFLALGENKGIKGISLFIYGPVHYASRTPIRNMADFKGKKVRVAASKVQEVAQQILGATGVSIPLAETLPALQLGTVDAIRLPINLFNTFKYHEVVKYVTLTEESIFVSFGVVSKAWFERLPPDLQQVVVQEGAALDKELTDWSKRYLADAADTWRKNGGEVIHFSPTEQSAFLERMSTVGDKVFGEQAEVLNMYKLLRTVAESNAK